MSRLLVGGLLKLDLSWLETQTLRRYNLRCFNIREDFATHQEVEAVVGNYSIAKWLSLKIGNKLGLDQSSADLEYQQTVTAIIHSHNFNPTAWLSNVN